MLRPATAAAVVRADVEVASRSEDRVVDVARRAARDAAFVRGAIFIMVLFALSPEGLSERRGERGEERFRALGSGGAGFQLVQGVYRSIGKLSPPIRNHENGAEVFLLDRACFHTFPPVRTEEVASGSHGFLNTSFLIGRIPPRLLPHRSTLATSPPTVSSSTLNPSKRLWSTK